MSSGDRTKPAATYKERNPFDISRRSEKEVAAEIAQRMVAWKQARGRSYGAPATVPTSEAKQQPSEAKKQPHIAAPVQPARLPKFGEHVARAPQPSGAAVPPASTPDARAASASERIPLFAMRRAMPPAPSLKQPSPPAPAPAPARPEPRVDMLRIDSLQIAAPLLESLIAEHPGTEAAKAAAEALRTQRPQPDPALEAEATVERQEIEPVASPTPAMQERVDTRELDSPDIGAPVAEIREPEPPAPMAAETEAEIPDLADQRADVPEADALAAEMPVAEPAAASASEPAERETHPFEARTIAVPRIDAASLETRADVEQEGRRDHGLDQAEARDSDAPSADALVARRDEIVTPAVPPIEPHAVEMPRLDPMAMEMRAAELAMSAERTEGERGEEASEREDPHLDVPKMDAPSIAPPAMEKSVAEIAVPADLTAKAAAAGSQTRARGDKLPRMETRIERRRADTLRADPWIAGRRPVFPRIELEAWDVPPPVVASRANRQRSGTGWAISLGTLLLVAGITAPAAIWQQGRQHPSDQDQVATLTPPPATPSEAPATSPATPVQAAPQPSTAPQQAAPQQAAPQQAAPQQQTLPQPSAPAAVTASSAPAAAPQPAAGTPAPDETTALGEVKNGGDLKQAPIVPPPAPKIAAAVAPASAPASKPKAQSEVPSEVSAGELANPMVPHPFVPDASPQPAPFRSDATSGAVVGAAAGAAAAADSVAMPVESAPAMGGAPATIALKPSLSGQLKPTALAAAKPTPAARQSVVRQPRSQYPQNLDQMFQNLIDTLSEGQPANPATKPLPPGNRR
jgi:hypothetical protein